MAIWAHCARNALAAFRYSETTFFKHLQPRALGKLETHLYIILRSGYFHGTREYYFKIIITPLSWLAEINHVTTNAILGSREHYFKVIFTPLIWLVKKYLYMRNKYEIHFDFSISYVLMRGSIFTFGCLYFAVQFFSVPIPRVTKTRWMVRKYARWSIWGVTENFAPKAPEGGH